MYEARPFFRTADLVSSAKVQRYDAFEQFPLCLPRARHSLEIRRIDHDVDVDVAVSCVAEAGDEQAIALTQHVDQGKEARDPAARNDYVMVDLQSRQGAKREREIAPDAPQLFAFGPLVRPQDLDGTCIAARLLDTMRLFQHAGFEAVHVQDQQRISALRRQPPAAGLGDRVETRAINQFHCCRDDAPFDESCDRRDCRLHVREACAQRKLHGWFGYETQNDLGQDRERALRSHQQLRHVVAHDVLDGLAASTDDLARRQHRLQSEDVPFGRAVLECARSTRALGNVAADHRLSKTRRVGRIEQTNALYRILQIACDDVGLDNGEKILLIDLEDAIQPFQADDQPAGNGDGSAGVSRAAAPNDERHQMAIAEDREPGNLARVSGQRHEVSRTAFLECVGAVGEEGDGIAAYPFASDDAFDKSRELRRQCHVVGLMRQARSAEGVLPAASSARTNA